MWSHASRATCPTSRMASMFRPSGLFPSMFFLITYCVFILLMVFFRCCGCGGDEMDRISLQAWSMSCPGKLGKFNVRNKTNSYRGKGAREWDILMLPCMCLLVVISPFGDNWSLWAIWLQGMLWMGKMKRLSRCVGKCWLWGWGQMILLSWRCFWFVQTSRLMIRVSKFISSP